MKRSGLRSIATGFLVAVALAAVGGSTWATATPPGAAATVKATNTAAPSAGVISTIGAGAGNGPASRVGQWPVGLAHYGSTLYIADQAYCSLRSYDVTTDLETVVATGVTGHDCPANPAVDGTGTLYFTAGFTVVQRRADGTQTVVAGNDSQGEFSSADEGAAATSIALNPMGLAFDAANELLIMTTALPSDTAAVDRIIAVDSAGHCHTVVGGQNPQAPTPALRDGFANMRSLAVTDDGKLHFLTNNGFFGFIYRLESDGTITDEAGFGQPGQTTGPAHDVKFYDARNIAADTGGGLLVADKYRVFRIDSAENVAVVAGSFNNPGATTTTMPATSARLGQSLWVASDGIGGFYIADFFAHRVHHVDLSGLLTPVAGDGTTGAQGEGVPISQAQLHDPEDMAHDSAGNLYIADAQANRIRKVATDGTVTTVAGNGASAETGDGGPATAAALYMPHAIAVSSDGSIYVADGPDSSQLLNPEPTPTPNVIRKISPGGTITTVAGGGTTDEFNATSEGTAATGLALDLIEGLAVTDNGDVYFTEPAGGHIDRVDPAGNWHRYAGAGSTLPTVTPTPAIGANLRGARRIVADNDGGFWLAGTYESPVHIRADGMVTGFGPSGSVTCTTPPGSTFCGDGSLSNLANYSADALAEDGFGDLFIADDGDSRILEITPDDHVFAVAGNGTFTSPSSDGRATAGSVPFPTSLQIVGDKLYVGTDAIAQQLRVVTGLVRSAVNSSTFMPTNPTVAYSTGTAPLTAGADRDVTLGGVPTNATAVVVNAQVTSPTAAGYLKVSAAGTNPPTAITFFRSGESTSTMAITPVTSGKVRLHLYAGRATVALTLEGYYLSGTGGDGYFPVTTTASYSSGSSPITATSRNVSLAGVPADAAAVVVNAEISNPTRTGYLRLAAAGTSATTVNAFFTAGQHTAASFTIPVAAGRARLQLSAGSANVTLYVLGFYRHGKGDGFIVTPPAVAFSGSPTLDQYAHYEPTITALPAATDAIAASVQVYQPNATDCLTVGPPANATPGPSVCFVSGQHTAVTTIPVPRGQQLRLAVTRSGETVYIVPLGAFVHSGNP